MQIDKLSLFLENIQNKPHGSQDSIEAIESRLENLKLFLWLLFSILLQGP